MFFVDTQLLHLELDLLVNVFDLIYLPANGCTVGTFGLSSNEEAAASGKSSVYHCTAANRLLEFPKLDSFVQYRFMQTEDSKSAAGVLNVARLAHLSSAK